MSPYLSAAPRLTPQSTIARFVLSAIGLAAHATPGSRRSPVLASASQKKPSMRCFPAARRTAIEEGMLTLRMDAWLKVMKGITTTEQMIRETSH